MSDQSKDVVTGKINLDTTKILPAFKVIDEGVRKNAESFKVLNAELVISEKNYVSMAKAMDKMALNSEERKKKIMDESNALVAQRKAATELLAAKKNQLDTTNQIVDSKLQTQQAIQKKRQDAIEQQEKEHLKRLETLSNRAATSGAQANKAAGNGSDEATRERVLQEEQKIRAKIAEMEEKQHKQNLNDIKSESDVRERTLQEEQKIRREIDKQEQLAQEKLQKANQNSLINAGSSDGSSSLLGKISAYATHALVFHTVTDAVNEAQHALKEGLVDIESNMAGYVQTNEAYFVSYNKGTGEMIMNTQKLSEETSKFLQTTHDLGADILDVTESARLWGRMYKDVNIVQEMVSESTKLSTVDLVGLQEATKGMESTLAQYAVQIRNTNDAQVQSGRIVDSWSSVAHNTMAPVNDLTKAFERTGKIAEETGASFDFMNGLLAAGVRNTALGGANLGNMWKSVLGNIRTDKAVNEIESLGVATKEVVNGVELWRKSEDILLDLSIKVIDKNYDLTKSYQDVAGGIYQYAKLAASLNVGDILLGESASINSTGSTLKYLEVQMDTIQRKAAQTKASLLAIFNQAGDDGLRTTIKGALDVIDQLLIGLTKVPKGAFEAGAGIAGLIILYKTVAPTLLLWKNAQQALTVAMQLNAVVTTEETVALIAQSAAARNSAMMTALATGGITILTGAIALWLFQAGKAEKQQNELNAKRDKEISIMEQQYSQYDRQAEFLPKLVNAHKELQKQMDSGNLTVEKQTEVKNQLNKVSAALKETIGEEGLAQLTAAGYTDDATKTIIASLNARRDALNKSISANLDLQASENTSALDAAQKKLKDVNDNPEHASTFLELLNPMSGPGQTGNMAKEKQKKLVKEASDEIATLEQTGRDIEQKRIDVAKTMAENVMAGQKGKADAESQGYEAQKKAFTDSMTDYKHLVSMQAEGYKTAAEQATKLKEIKDKFKGLDSRDLYGIDEDIYNSTNGGNKNSTSFEAAMADYNHQVNMQTKGYETAELQAKRLKEIKSKFKDLSKEQSNGLDEDIHRADNNVLDKAKGFGGGKTPFSLDLNDIDLQTKQAKDLVDSADSIISFYESKRSALGGVVDDTSIKVGLYTNKQNQLRDSNVLLKGSLTELSGRQESLNSMQKAGKISTEEYNKASEDVQTRISSITKELATNSTAWWNQAKVIKEAKEQQLQNSFDFSSKWISHEKATREMSAQEEYNHWLDVQARYKKGTELRKEADEQVYAAKGRLISEEEDSLEKAFNKEKDFLNDSKQNELDAIDEAKQKFVDAQDEKIKKIDDLIKAQDEANSDSDYATSLAEKQARLGVLASAVGPEGIKERKDLTKEIEKMQLDHTRELTKRDLEVQKQALEDEKGVKEKQFEQDKKDVENNYKVLLKAFDTFTNDSTGRAETLKNIQIAKESEKNTTILSNLDTFISDYQKKMAAITNLSQTQEQIDLQTYNANIDKYNTGSATDKTAAHTDNEALRIKYGVKSDSGKLQHFKDGGVVQGGRGEPVPVIAHGGEIYMNEAQQSNLFKLLNFAMPKLSYALPNYDMGKSSSTQIVNHWTITSGDVNLHDDADIKTYFNERNDFVERTQAVSGVKQR